MKNLFIITVGIFGLLVILATFVIFPYTMYSALKCESNGYSSISFHTHGLFKPECIKREIVDRKILWEIDE